MQENRRCSNFQNRYWKICGATSATPFARSAECRIRSTIDSEVGIGHRLAALRLSLGAGRSSRPDGNLT